MRRFYGVVALMLMMPALPALGQVQVIETIRFTSNSNQDDQQRLTFGFGSQYGDTADLALGEQIFPPFFPPEGFYVYHARPDDRGGEDFMIMDVRGVPDSVRNAGANHFSLIYTMRLKRGTGQQVTISFPNGLRRGIDSINVMSPQAGSNLNHTFTTEGGSVMIHELITTVRMTAYFNYDRAASVPDDRRIEGQELAIIPNPARAGGMLALGGDVPAGAHLVVSDLYGSTVLEQSFGEGGTRGAFTIPSVPAGIYMVRLVGSDGEMLRQGRVVVVR